MKMPSINYQDVFESAPYVMLLVNKEGSIIDINQAGLEYFQTAQQKTPGQSCGVLFNCINSLAGEGCGFNLPCLKCPVRQSINQTFKTGQPLQNKPASMVFSHPAGAIQRELLISTNLVEKGGDKLVLLSVVDVTNIQKTNQELDQAHESLASILDSIDAIVYVADMETHKILYLNEPGRKFYGDVIGKPCWQYLQKGMTGPCPFCTNKKLISDDGKPTGVYRWESKNTSSQKWYDCRDVAIRWLDGRLVRMEIASDITSRKMAEDYREMGLEILQVLNEPGDMQKIFERVIRKLKQWTGFDAVGIRLQDGEDFPYISQKGFSDDFLLKESTLVERNIDGGICRDKNGNACLECTCGLVISGDIDPDNPLFTRGGSAWTNDSFPFLDVPIAQDPRMHPRNECIHQGYASIALIPIKIKERAVGLIHFGDSRKDCFTLETIEMLEGIAGHLGEALVRKQMEGSIEKNEKRLSSILNNMKDVVWSVSWPDLRLQYISSSAEKLYGRPLQDFYDNPALFKEVTHPEDRHLTENAIEQLLEEGEAVRECRVVRPDGSFIWVYDRSRLVCDENQQPVRVEGLTQDITERKEAQEALLKKQQFDSLQAEVAEAFLNMYELGQKNTFKKVMQRTGEFFAADKSFLFELSPEDGKMISAFHWDNQVKSGQPVLNRNQPLKLADFSWAQEQTRRYGYFHVSDAALIPPEGGREIEVLSHLNLKSIIAVPLIVQDALYGYLAYGTTAEARHWHEEQIKSIKAIGEKIVPVLIRQRFLKQKKEAYDKALAVLDSIDALIYVADMETYEIEYINRLGLQLWGDIEGKKCWESLQKNQAGPCDFCVNYKLLDENGQSTGIHKWQNKNLVTGKWYEISDQAISWIDGTIKRLSVALDVTMLKETAQKLEEARQEAEQANRAKSRFLAAMSHEIRNPMNVITGMTGLLREANLKEPLSEYAAMANDSANHLLAIIGDILDFSRIEADKLEITASRVKLVQVMERTLSTLKNQANQKGLELLVYFDEQLPLEVLLDAGRLKQVLINLVGNAIKFTEKGVVELTISLRRAGSAVTELDREREILFAVKDTGPGILEKDQHKIFESFSQVGKSKYQGSDGTGLGLSISKKLVELMGGQLWLESEPGKGSTFYFTLPCKTPVRAETAQRDAEQTTAPPEDRKENLSLLLVEDKPMNQKLVKVFFEQMGHQVEIASNGKEAVEAFQRRHYDAVFMDINMPEMDGVEATKIIRAWEHQSRPYRTAIIAMTAYAMKGDREQFLEAGLDDYISKPITKENLANTLQRVLLTQPRQK